MSTANFHSMDNFNLFAKVYEPMELEDYKENEFEYDDYLYPKYQEAEEYEKEDILEESYNHAMRLWEEDFYHEIYHGYDGFNSIMEELNQNLLFHKLEIKSGYYDGVQIFVKEMENPNELDNEDCRYYYDMCRSQAIRKYEAEIRKINRFLNKEAVEYGWKKLNCLGVFSNGEAVYQFA